MCTLVQKEPQKVLCCGKVYCKSCLEHLRRTMDRFLCPNCQTSLEGYHKFFPDRNTAIKINHLRVHCTNKVRGCEWVGHLKDLDEEHLSKCPNEFVCCNIKKSDGYRRSRTCGARVQRHQLERHKNECEWKQVSCLYCKKVGSYRDISEHQKQDCLEVLLTCSNEGCHEKVKHCLMTDHRKVCPKQIVSCEYASIGCKEKVKRDDMVAHKLRCVKNHLEKAVTTIEDLQSEIGPGATVRISGLTDRFTDSMSLGFYTSKGGYKIRLKAELGGSLTVYAAGMPGRYDDTLQWPANGCVTIELLNVEINQGHSSITSELTLKKRVVPPFENGEWIRVGYFSLHKSVYRWYSSTFEPKYIIDGTAYLKVSVKWHFKFESKEWLYGR